MSGSLNRVMLIGNLVRDPEIRQSQDGSRIVTFSVATSENWKDKATGERRERAEFHRVVVFNDHLAGVAEKFLKKGKKVFLDGQLQTRKWVDQNTGQERFRTEVVLPRFRGELTMLDTRGSESPSHNFADNSSEQGLSDSDSDSEKGFRGGSARRDEDVIDDEIPF